MKTLRIGYPQNHLTQPIVAELGIMKMTMNEVIN